MHILELLSTLSRKYHAVIACALLAVIGVIDYRTGYELRMELFYLMPITYATWFLGQRSGVLFSLLSMIVIVSADITAGKPYTHFTVEVWNGALYLVFYVIVTAILKLHVSLQQRENLLEDLDTALEQNEELSGLLPVCVACKKVRDDAEYRKRVENYVARHARPEIGRSLCPECAAKLPAAPKKQRGDTCGD